MTRKQMKNLAKEIYKCEIIHEDDSSSREDKIRAENRLLQLTNQIMSLKNGFNIMLEIDTLVQKLFNEEKGDF